MHLEKYNVYRLINEYIQATNTWLCIGLQWSLLERVLLLTVTFIGIVSFFICVFFFIQYNYSIYTYR